MKQLLLLFTLCIFVPKVYAQGTWTNVVWTTDGLNLGIFDHAACNYELIGEIEDEMALDIAFTPNGKLYGIGMFNIFEIDTATALPTEICTLPETFWGHPSLTHLNDSILLTDFNDTLWSINVHTCELLPMGVIGYSPRYEINETGDTLSSVEVSNSDGDLVWCMGKLYTISWDRLYEIKLNADHTGILSSTFLNLSDYNMPIATGLATIGQDEGGSSSGERLLCFGDYMNVFTVDPVTLAVDTFCTYDGEVYAAWGATMRPKYIPSDTTDTVTGIYETTKQHNIAIYPNPVSDNQIHVQYEPGMNIHGVSLYNTLGRRYKVNIQTRGQQETVLNLPGKYANGIYILEIQTDRGILYRKILLE